MVEEGVTWFAQVAPRQPRTLVVVVPPPAWIVAPLPLLVAVWGLFALRRSRRDRSWSVTSRAWDVWWCAATLAAKPLILAHTALLEPTVVAYWLILTVAVIVPMLGLLILPRRVRPWVLLAVGIFCSLLILADIVYYRFFGDVLSTPALLAVHQTGHVWGSVGSLFTPGLVWLLVDWPFAFWLAVRMSAREAAPGVVPRSGGHHVGGDARRAVGERRGGGGSAGARIHPARSDVPRALGRRTTRSLRLPRLRHVELRPQHVAATAGDRRLNSTRRRPGFANAHRCEPAGSASARLAAGI